MDDFQTWEKQGEELGRGSFGVVYLVRTNRGDLLAAKYIDKSKMGVETISREIMDEVRILRQLNHPNVVKLVDVREEGVSVIVFTEYIKGKDLKSHGKLAEATAKGYLKEICAGLNYLHTRRPAVLHRDIKGQNIMVGDGSVKLIDFGLSVNIMAASGMTATQVIMTTNNACGTQVFMAPELFKKPCRFSVKSDVWALGLTVYQMMTGQFPFESNSATNTEAFAESIRATGAPELPDGCSHQLVDFYSRCTALEPSARWSVKQLLNHALFA